MPTITKKTAEPYIELLKLKGSENLYKHFVASGIRRSMEVNIADVELLDLSDAFFAFNRKSGHDDEIFLIGKLLRKAAHTLYRNFNKLDKNRNKNNRFLQLV